MSTHYLAKLKVAHRARDTIEFLRRETPYFIGPEPWPANSPDLNPVDCRIWGLMQERVYQSPIQDVDDLKLRCEDLKIVCKGLCMNIT